MTVKAYGATAGDQPLAPLDIPRRATGPGDDTLDLHEQERMSIERALERFGGNRRKAAEALHISTVTLWRTMKRYGVTQP